MDKDRLPFPGFGTSPELFPEGHHCKGELPKATYGVAVTHCYEDNGEKLWVSNDEYASQVNFCPYCGYEAKIEVRCGDS